MARSAYNSPHLLMEIRPTRRVRAVALVAMACLFPVLALAQPAATSLQQGARELAKRIAEKSGPGAVYLDFNVVDVSGTDTADLRHILETELIGRGVRLANRNSSGASVSITLSQNPQGYVWIAQLRQGATEPMVIILPVDRSTVPPPPRAPAVKLTVRKTLLWTQEQPILDVAHIEGGGNHLLVLDPFHVTLYRWTDNKWDPEQVLGIYHARPWPRDIRGRLVLRRDHLFDAYLPGVVCVSANTSPISMTCREADDPWPLSQAQGGQNGFFSPVRNFFNGTLVPGLGAQTTTAPFYSAVTLPRPGASLWITNSIDGATHVLDGTNDQQLRPGWGSAMTAVRSKCGSGFQVLVSNPTDYTAADAVTPMEFNDRSPSAAGEGADFPGPVVELWDTSDPATATAVVRNNATNLYEAYALSVACGQ